MGGNNKITFPDYLVAFDGNCLMCNRLAVFIHDNDPNAKIKFITLAELPEAFVAEHKLEKVDSVLFIEKGIPSIKTEAAVKIGKQLGWFYRFLATIVGGINYVVSLNGIYDYIAKNRLKWFGKADSCSFIPEMQMRFVTL